MRPILHTILWPAAMVAVAGCGDLAMNPDQEPAKLGLTPEDTLMTAGDAGKLTLLVFDRDGNLLPDPPPSWAVPTWEWTDSSALEIESDGQFVAHEGGDLRVTAHLAGLSVWTGLRINPSSIRLSAPAIYLNQVIQNPPGDVRLIAGRPAFLRIFATGDQVSFYQLDVRADFYREGEVVHSVTMVSGSDVLLDEIDESSLERSFNAEIPVELIEPGLELVVELDINNTIPKAPGSQTRYPAQGTMRLDIIEMPLFEQTFVPTLTTRDPNNPNVFNWLRGIGPDSRQVEATRTLLPVGEMEIAVHDTFFTDANLTTTSGWSAYLRDIETLWHMEGRQGYYYGVVQPPGGSPYGGLGYLDRHASVGAPNPGTYSHEVGHNMTLRHAPCGGAPNPDPGFPSDFGSIGRWGYDFRASRLVSPGQYKDLMGYCDPNWVSDYHFKRAMAHRLTAESPAAAAAGPQQTLMLWGSASSSEVLLEPAFLVESVPDMPATGGPWRLTGLGPGGEHRFDFGFTPNEIDHGGANFMFHMPYDPDRDGVLESVILSGPDGEFTLGRSGAPPMAIIRDPASGQVRAILRDWPGSFSLAGDEVEVMVSDGLPGGGR